MQNRIKLAFFSFGLLLIVASNIFAVDMTVFGFTLGEKLSITECERKSLGYENSKSMCFERFSKYVNGVETYPTEPPNNENLLIKFPYGDSPQIVSGNVISGIILDGKLEGISFSTSGISDADYVLAKLQEKYGKPSTYIPRKIENAMGASFDSFIAGWKLENLDISFFGVKTKLDEGQVFIDTNKGGAWRKKQHEELNKDKRPL